MLTEILPDIYMLQMPIPESRVRSIDHIRLFIIRGPERNLLFDTGINQPSSLEPILAAFDELGISTENTDIFVSHLHPDHCGLAYKLQSGTRFTSANELQTAAEFYSTDESQKTSEFITENELQTTAEFYSAGDVQETAGSITAHKLQTTAGSCSVSDMQETSGSGSATDICSAVSRRPRVYAHEKEAELIRIVSSEEYWRGRYNEYLTEGLPMNFEEFYNSHPAAEHFPEPDIDFTVLQDGDIIDLGIPADAANCFHGPDDIPAKAADCFHEPDDIPAETSDKAAPSVRLQNSKWRCIVASGHSPAHTCLYNEEQQILLGGDVILDKVVPVLFPEPDFPDPLGTYLDGLDRLTAIPVSHFLSSHETLEFDMRERIQQLQSHYMQKCSRILEPIQARFVDCDDRTGITAWDIARLTVRDEIPRDLEQLSPVTRWFFFLPVCACLRYLERTGKINVHTDPEGIRRYALK